MNVVMVILGGLLGFGLSFVFAFFISFFVGYMSMPLFLLVAFASSIVAMVYVGYWVAKRVQHSKIINASAASLVSFNLAIALNMVLGTLVEYEVTSIAFGLFSSGLFGAIGGWIVIRNDKRNNSNKNDNRNIN